MIAFSLQRRYPIIMRPRRYRSEALVDLFEKQKIATLPELKEALGTRADITVFRRLAELPYRTSYTHRGKYYTLDTIPEYDEWGLWCCRSACFSKRGTLVDTAAALVGESRPPDTAGRESSNGKGLRRSSSPEVIIYS